MQVLGNKVKRNVLTRGLDVIGAVEQTPAHNVAIRIGRMHSLGVSDGAGGTTSHGSWEQHSHVVLTPEEVDILIETLMAARLPMRTRRSEATREWETPINPADAEALRRWIMYGDYSQVLDPWHSLIEAWEQEHGVHAPLWLDPRDSNSAVAQQARDDDTAGF